MLPKWEYKEIKLNPLSSFQKELKFKRMGKDGWELVSVSDGTAYFKRPVKEKGEVYTLHPSGEILPKENAHFNRLLEEKKRYKELLFQFRSMVLELIEADNAEVRKRAYLLIDSCYDDNGELIV